MYAAMALKRHGSDLQELLAVVSKLLNFLFLAFASGVLLSNSPFRSHGQSDSLSGYVRIDASTHERLTRTLEPYVRDEQLANLSYAVWQSGTRVAEGYFGPVGQTRAETVSDTTIYRIRSMTKPVTAIGLLILMERGHFELTDPITKFLPEFETTETLADYDSDGTLYTYPALYPPTMGQLLNHSAGFAYWRPNGGIIDERLLAADVASSPDANTLVQRVAEVPFIALPGSEWNYSLSSDLQGAVIERITGMRLGDFLDLALFQPLGMTETAFYVADEKQHRISDITRRTPGGYEYADSPLDDRASQQEVYDEGGHGLYSTLRDYHRFLDMLHQDGRLGERTIITPRTLQAFRTNAIRYRGGPGRQRSYGVGAGLGFGLGVGTIEDRLKSQLSAPVGTYYWSGSLGTWFWVDPVNDIIFIGMVQNENGLFTDPMRVAMTAIYGEPPGAD